MLTFLALVLAAQVSTSTSTSILVTLAASEIRAKDAALAKCDAVRSKLRNAIEERDGQLAGERAAHEQTRRILINTPPLPAAETEDAWPWWRWALVLGAGAAGASGGGAIGAAVEDGGRTRNAAIGAALGALSAEIAALALGGGP